MENQPETPQQTPPAPVNETTPITSSLQSKLPLILLVILLLFLFGTGGLFLGKYFYASNWKTYSNKELNFLIKYPSEWIIDSDTEAKSLNTIRFYQSITDETNNPKLIPKINIHVIENKNISLENFEKNFKNPTKFSVNGVMGLKGYEKSSYYGTENNYTAYIISNNLTYIFTMGMDTNDNLINIFDQILSTFKFL